MVIPVLGYAGPSEWVLVPGEHLPESSQHIIQSPSLHILRITRKGPSCLSNVLLMYYMSVYFQPQTVASPAGWDLDAMYLPLSLPCSVSRAQNAFFLEPWGLKNLVSPVKDPGAGSTSKFRSGSMKKRGSLGRERMRGSGEERGEGQRAGEGHCCICMCAQVPQSPESGSCWAEKEFHQNWHAKSPLTRGML